MTTTNDPTEALQSLGLKASPDAIRALLTHATKSKLSVAAFALDLVSLEKRARDERNLAARTTSAALGAVKALDRFDWTHPRAIDRELYEDLHNTLGFIERGENVLLRGQAGVGKSSLAKHLGYAALAKGHTVRYATLPAALADLLCRESIPATERRLRHYTNPDLLILDELGYVPCDAEAADLLFRIVSRRHESKAVVITTNLAYKAWGPSSAMRRASVLSSIASRSTATCSTSMPTPGATRNGSRNEGSRPRRSADLPRGGDHARDHVIALVVFGSW